MNGNKIPTGPIKKSSYSPKSNESKSTIQDIDPQDKSVGYFHSSADDCYSSSPEHETMYFNNNTDHLLNADTNSDDESYQKTTSRRSSISENHIDDSTNKGLENEQNNITEENITEERLAELVKAIDVTNPDNLMELLKLLAEKFTLQLT